VALLLRERLHIGPGDRVTMASPLRPERVVAEWAVVIIGAVVDYTRGDTPDRHPHLPPKAAFVASATAATRLLDSGGLTAPSMIVFDPDGALPTGARRWTEVLDLGGTLDTPERAERLRAEAERLPEDAPALEHRQRDGTRARWTQRDVARRLYTLAGQVQPEDGDLAYVSVRGHREGPCLPVWAFVADGVTSTLLGTSGYEAQEIAEHHPRRVVGPPGLCASAIPRPSARALASRVAARVVERLPVFGAAMGGHLRAHDRGVRDVMTFDGDRID
jgi:hypothetical protein